MKIFIFTIFLSLTSHALPLPEGAYTDLLQKNSLNRATQAFCYEDESGVIIGDNIDQKVIPASVTKAYTSYVALKKFGPEFRFQTRFEIRTDTLGTHLNISGDHDGYFLNDQLFYVLNLIQSSGITQLKEITFDSKFYLNLNLEPTLIKADLQKVFQTSTWETELKTAYDQFVKRALKLGLNVSASIPKMSVAQVRSGVTIQPSPSLLFTIQSLPLINLLKDMNVHSTNRFAKSVFVRLNDPNGFNQTLYQDLNTDESQMKFHDGSGGQSNYTTCRVTLKLFKSLESILSAYALKLDDVISVAGIDGGTLRNRFNQPDQLGSIMGKTGTLPDIGVSTLAGKISSLNGTLFFGIFNRYPIPNLKQAKDLQNSLVDKILKTHSGKKEIQHQPWNFEVLKGLL